VAPRTDVTVAGLPRPTPFLTIAQENALDGEPRATWLDIGTINGNCLGFARETSYLPGQTAQFAVHCSTAFTSSIWRLGHYGGDGGRRVADAIAGTPVSQSNGTENGTTRELDLGHWTTNLTWSIPADATPGVYLVLVNRTSDSAKSHIIFVVREPVAVRRSSMVVKLSETTWGAAYNYAGQPGSPFTGRSLYGTSGGFDTNNRAFTVSFNRPVVTRGTHSVTHFFNAEYPLLKWVEQQGYDVTYLSSVDIDRDPSLLLDRTLVVSSGHDEYWSNGMWDAFTDARDAGVNLAYFSGNEMFWRVRFENDHRRMICYKDSLAGSNIDPGGWTGTHQDTRGMNPDRRAANSIHGLYFRVNGIRNDDIVISAGDSTNPLWRDTPIEGVGGNLGDGTLGFEWDAYEPGYLSMSPNIVRLSTTSVGANGFVSDDNGAVYDLDGTISHGMSLSLDPSGALVFAAGTCQWAWGLDDLHYNGGAVANTTVRQATVNLLADLGMMPTTLAAGLITPTPATPGDYGLS
jgi:hypothetical protein